MYSRGRWSISLQNTSMILYIIWLMLPAVQVLLKAVTGVLILVVFAAGVLLDGEALRKHWRVLIPRVVCMAALPFILLLYLNRGGDEPLGFYAQQVMFWFPLLWCAHTAQTGNRTAYPYVFAAMLMAFAITALSTSGWSIEGILNDDGDLHVYSRALGSGQKTVQAYRDMLLGRNIGGYGFVYAGVLALPMLFYLAGGKGWKRWVFSALYALAFIMIVLTQYTYAFVLAAAITAVELLGLMLRRICKKLPVGVSMLLTLPVFILVFLLRVPLVTELISLADRLDFPNVTLSLEQLHLMITGAATADGSRLEMYTISWQSFLDSPIVGGIFNTDVRIGLHSELLDLLAGLGILGMMIFLAGIWLIGRGIGKGLRGSDAMPHLWLQWIVCAALAAVNTVFYSREIPLVLCLCIAFAVWTAREKSGIIKHTKV